MRRGVTRAAWVLAPWFFVACLVTVWNPPSGFWSGVETPKAQVEAYDVARLKTAAVLDASIYAADKLHRWVREPQNTLSNFAYVFTGFAVLFSARRAASRSFGLACIFLGIGSGLYHASLLTEWRLVDILGVYAALFSLIVVGGAALLGTERRGLPFIFATWIAAFLTGIYRNEVRLLGFKVFDSTYVVVASIVIASALALGMFRRTTDRRRYRSLMFLLVASAGLACFGGLADRFGGVWADPEGLVQGHAVWHAFGAAALLAAYEIFVIAGYDRSVFAIAQKPHPSAIPSFRSPVAA